MEQTLGSRVFDFHDLVSRRLLSRKSRSRLCFQSQAFGWFYKKHSVAEIEKAIGGCTEWLVQKGVTRGDRVVIALPSSLEWMVIEFACYRLGAAVIGIEPFAPSHYLERARSELKPKLIVDQTVQRPSIQRWGRDKNHNSHKNSLQGVRGEPNDIATFIMTSGTSGPNRWVSYTQAQILEAAVRLCEHLREDIESLSNRHLLVWLPMANLFQRMTLWVAIQSDSKVTFIAHPKELMKALIRFRPSVFIGVPKVFEKLARLNAVFVGRFNQRGILHHLFNESKPLLISGSARLREDVEAQFHRWGLTISQAYGLSECVLPVSVSTRSQWKIGSVGKPLNGNMTRITSGGELLLSGPFLGSRFDEQPANQWYATGDIVELDREGFLFHRGRISSRMKLSNGKRIDRAELESRLPLAPFVETVVIVGQDQDVAGILVECKRSTYPPTEVVLKWTARVDQLLKEMKLSKLIRFTLLVPRSFTAQGGEMTLNLKLRYHVVEQKFAQQIQNAATQAQASGVDTVSVVRYGFDV